MLTEPTYRGPGAEKSELAGNSNRTPIDHYYMLIIAIDDYKNGFNPLNNPVSDANEVVKVLINDYTFYPSEKNKAVEVVDLRKLDPTYAGHREPIPVYKDDDFRRICLYNDAATKNEIINTLDNIFLKIGENDALLIYFSGHGIRAAINEEYYLACHDSVSGQRGTYLAITEIFSNFKNYPVNKKCRDFLLILDSCFAGSSTFGTSEQVGGSFSRSALTSSLHNQPADDGPKGKGSSFANIVVRVLKDNNNPYLPFNEFGQSVRNLFKQFTDIHKLAKQEVIWDNLPTKTGQGSFVFEKQDKDKPKPGVLKNYFIDHLDFEEHRGDLNRLYRNTRNCLNIITTQGYSFEVQKILSKIVFRWFNGSKRGFDFIPEICLKLDPIKIDKRPEETIWQILYNQIKTTTGSQIINDPENIHEWFFQKLSPGGNKDYEGKRHLILWIYFSVGGNENFDRIQTFCEEFSSLFLAKHSQLSAEEKLQRGKMFIIFSDERDNGENFPKESFNKVTNLNNFNLIPTKSVSQINENHIGEWIERIMGFNQSNKIQQLNLDVVKTVVGKENCSEFECRYEDFVKHICTYFDYSQQEKTELDEYLFDFNKSLI